MVEYREMCNFMFYLLSIQQPSRPLRFTMKKVTERVKDSGLANLTILVARVAAQRLFWQRWWIVLELVLARQMSFQLCGQSNSPDVLHQLSRAPSGYDERTMLRRASCAIPGLPPEKMLFQTAFASGMPGSSCLSITMRLTR